LTSSDILAKSITYVARDKSYKYIRRITEEHVSIVNEFNIIKLLGRLFNGLPDKHPLTAKVVQPEIAMQKLPITRCIAFSLLSLLLCSASSFAANTVELTLGAETYQVELAATTEQRRRGLMQRRYLAPRQGMLLAYSWPGDHRIWMKNMLIPLWVYWIDAGHVVIERRRLEPCIQQPCPVYSANGDSLYILELGDYEHPLAVGDRVVGIPGY
jgi:uncharacterized protein